MLIRWCPALPVSSQKFGSCQYVRNSWWQELALLTFQTLSIRLRIRTFTSYLLVNISSRSFEVFFHMFDIESWKMQSKWKTRSSWVNCALRDEEAVYWVSVAHYEAVAVGNWWYWVSRGHLCLYILRKVEIWTGVTDASLTDSLTHNWKTKRPSFQAW